MWEAQGIQTKRAQKRSDRCYYMQKKVLFQILLLMLACFSVYVTAATTKIEIQEHSDLKTLSCGWPLKFIMNDQSQLNPPLPWKIACLGGQWGDPMGIYWPQLFIDIAFFYALISLFSFGIRFIIKKRGAGNKGYLKSFG